MVITPKKSNSTAAYTTNRLDRCHVARGPDNFVMALTNQIYHLPRVSAENGKCAGSYYANVTLATKSETWRNDAENRR
jgi:hypothetical protein